MESLQIRMFGEFSIASGAAAVHSSGDRSKKVWLLIACLIDRRGTCVPAEELVLLLWGSDPKGSNPLNALKTLFHRARALLSQLEDCAGHALLLRQEGGYAWNPAVPVWIDTDHFTRLCLSAAGTAGEEQRLAALLEAAELYRGDFLEKLSEEPWVIPIAARFRRQYEETVQEAFSLLSRRDRWPEAVSLCRAAWRLSPCSEPLCHSLMEALLHTGDYQGASDVYTELRRRLMATQGTPPSGELRALYQNALRLRAPDALTPGDLLAQLQEPASGGAMICDYDFFRTICHACARLAERSGDAAQLLLISVSGTGGSLASHSLDRVMDHLQELLRLCLRRGDAAARCGVSQYAVLLPRTRYEDSQTVCQRISKTFRRQYPHSPAQLHIDTQPLDLSSEQ